MKSVFWEVDYQHVQTLYMNNLKYNMFLWCLKVGHICINYCTLLLHSLTGHSCCPASHYIFFPYACVSHQLRHIYVIMSPPLFIYEFSFHHLCCFNTFSKFNWMHNNLSKVNISLHYLLTLCFVLHKCQCYNKLFNHNKTFVSFDHSVVEN